MDRITRRLQNIVLSAKNLKQRLWIIPLFWIPLLLVMGILQTKHARLKIISEEIDQLEQKSAHLQLQKERQQETLNQIDKRGPNYLSQTVEKLPLLAPELQRVQALARQYPENSALQERLSFLQGDKNRIRLIEISPHQFKLLSSVQMNTDDLRKFLLAVEGETYSGIEFQELFLQRQREKSDEWVYTLQATFTQKTL
jgi:hypothetical protein